jgi:hypothetical protein
MPGLVPRHWCLQVGAAFARAYRVAPHSSQKGVTLGESSVKSDHAGS